MPQGTFVAEREWARALARHVANQLPEAVRQAPDIQLTPVQIEQLRKVFENTLITNMGWPAKKKEAAIQFSSSNGFRYTWRSAQPSEHAFG